MRTRHLVIGALLAIGSMSAAVSAARADGFNPAHVLQANARYDDATVMAPQQVSETEAKLWILNAGYDQVSGLEIVGPGVYQGTALANGDTYDVVVDSAGNVLGVKE